MFELNIKCVFIKCKRERRGDLCVHVHLRLAFAFFWFLWKRYPIHHQGQNSLYYLMVPSVLLFSPLPRFQTQNASLRQSEIQLIIIINLFEFIYVKKMWNIGINSIEMYFLKFSNFNIINFLKLIERLQ